MNLNKLNPFVRSVAIYEKQIKLDECIGYDCRLLFVLSGELSVSLSGGKAERLSVGKMLYIPAGTPYKIKGQYFKLGLITFDPDDSFSSVNSRIVPVSKDNFDISKCHVVSDFSSLEKPILASDMDSERDCIIRMYNLFISADGSFQATLSALLKLILLKLIDISDENALPQRLSEGLDTYIRENVGEEISNTELGAIFGYHPFYISTVLKEKKGQTLRQYVIFYRLKYSKSLLELTDKSINEIAEKCGFTDASYFTKTFKANFGVTPKEYRNTFKEDFI